MKVMHKRAVGVRRWGLLTLAGLLACSVAGDEPLALDAVDPRAEDAVTDQARPSAQTPGFDLTVAAAGSDVVITYAAQLGATQYELWASDEPLFEPGDASSSLVATQAGTEQTVVGGALVETSTYWRVVALVDGGEEASATVGAWVQPLSPGYSLASFPLLGTGVTDAESLAAEIPELTEIWHYDTEGGGFAHWYGTGEDNLDWEPGEAIPVYASTATAIVFRQFGHVPVPADLVTTLAPGLNVMTVPIYEEPTDALGLGSELVAVEQLARWDAAAQDFEYFGLPNWGVNFDLWPGQGVWIWVSEAQPWPTSDLTCGNGIVDGDEECDDGNLDDYDGCESTCERTVAEAMVSAYMSCIRTIYGDVKCWGAGQYTGNQVLDNIGDDETPAAVGFVDLGAPAVDISLAGNYVCAALETGAIRCFGRNGIGSLGLGVPELVVGDDEPPTAYPPVDFGDLGGASFVQVTAAWGSTACGLLDTGGVRCWGDPRGLGWGVGGLGTIISPPAGAVGDDETPAEAGLGDVPIGLPATELFSVSVSHLARTSTGSIRAWGSSSQYAMGAAYTPIAINPGEPFTSDVGDLPFDGIEMDEVSFGSSVACSVQSNGDLYCWGYGGGWGGLGLPGVNSVGGSLGPTIPGAGPVDVGGPAALVEAHGYGACAARVDGEVRCWGTNSFGQAGRGNTTTIGDDELPSTGNPTDLGGTVVAFAEGVQAYHFCALLETGALKCWGRNNFGQLGYGHTDDVGDEPGEMGASLPAVPLF